MICSDFVNLIKGKVNYTKLSITLFVVGLVGVVLQMFEPYTMFWVMFPILLIMLLSVILILQFCLRELDKFHEIMPNSNGDKENVIKKYCILLFPERNSSILLGAYLLMVTIYFICIYCMHFVEISIMGLYILILGGGTFFLALICYEVCIRLTVSLKNIEKNISEIEYDNIYPQNTIWLQYFFRFHKVLKNAALTISALFVVENSMLFFANYQKLQLPALKNIWEIPNFFKALPFEWWVIWIYIFVTIVVAIPFMTQFRIRSFNKIVSYIQTDFQTKIVNNCKKIILTIIYQTIFLL